MTRTTFLWQIHAVRFHDLFASNNHSTFYGFWLGRWHKAKQRIRYNTKTGTNRVKKTQMDTAQRLLHFQFHSRQQMALQSELHNSSAYYSYKCEVNCIICTAQKCFAICWLQNKIILIINTPLMLYSNDVLDNKDKCNSVKFYCLVA